MRRWKFISLFMLLPVSLPGMSTEGTQCAGKALQVDPEKGEVTFTVTQGEAPFSGRFREFGGVVCHGGNGVQKIEVWLDPASVDTGLPEVDQLLATSQFFRLDEYPRVTFLSRRVEHLDAGRVRATGTLTINGRSREREVEFQLSKENGQWHAQGRFTLPRLAYQLGTGEWEDTEYLANEVVVEFEAKLDHTPGQ